MRIITVSLYVVDDMRLQFIMAVSTDLKKNIFNERIQSKSINA